MKKNSCRSGGRWDRGNRSENDLNSLYTDMKIQSFNKRQWWKQRNGNEYRDEY